MAFSGNAPQAHSRLLGKGDGVLAAQSIAFAGLYTISAVPVFTSALPPLAIWMPSLVLGAVLALLSAIDVQSQRLPNILTLPLILAGLLFTASFGWDSIWNRLFSAAAAYLLLFCLSVLYERYRGREGLGLGDAKLLAASAAWLGFDGVPTVLFGASVTALFIVLIAYLCGKRLSHSTRIPFGPFLAFATWLVWLYGPIL